MEVVVVEEAADAEEVSDADEVGSQFVHHLILAGTGVREVELSAEDGREDVELLRNVVAGVTRRRRRRCRGARSRPQARRDALEIQRGADGTRHAYRPDARPDPDILNATNWFWFN